MSGAVQVLDQLLGGVNDLLGVLGPVHDLLGSLAGGLPGSPEFAKSGSEGFLVVFGDEVNLAGFGDFYGGADEGFGVVVVSVDGGGGDGFGEFGYVVAAGVLFGRVGFYLD